MFLTVGLKVPRGNVHVWEVFRERIGVKTSALQDKRPPSSRRPSLRGSAGHATERPAETGRVGCAAEPMGADSEAIERGRAGQLLGGWCPSYQNARTGIRADAQSGKRVCFVHLEPGASLHVQNEEKCLEYY